jgi:hypothetical protein
VYLYTFKKIDTEFFQPDKQYIKKSLKADEVGTFMKEEKYKTPVYMITGMKIARGATNRPVGYGAGLLVSIRKDTQSCKVAWPIEQQAS